MARKAPEYPPVHRCDLLPSPLTAAKAREVRALLAAYRRGAVLLAREQWRLFFETGRFQKNHDRDKATFAAVIGAANRVQMARWQVVGQLDSWLANRANEFRGAVQGSTLPEDTRRMLHAVGTRRAWWRPGDVALGDGTVVPLEVLRLARSIMRGVMARHRRPDLSRTSMRLDARVADLQAPRRATQKGRIGWWVNLSTMEKGKKIAVPLRTYAHREGRRGTVANGVQVSEDRGGALRFRVVTDIASACAESRAAYAPLREALALDFGLSTLFATEDGDLLGRNWLGALRRYDDRLQGIARHVQRAGGRPKDSRRYRTAVEALRGWIRTEVGRVLNRLVAERRPAVLALERLDFRNPTLSRRMNRLLQNCGRSVIRAKLRDLEERFGVTAEEQNPAYTSQECSSCGYVDKANRPAQARFRCLWCGQEMHADCNAARTIGRRRASSFGSPFQRKDAILGEVVRAFSERRPRASRAGRSGQRGLPADPRTTNPYFGGERPRGARSSGRRRAVQKSGTHQPMVCA